MSVVFADTFYFLALLNKQDEDHAQAVEASREQSGRLVTTAWVLTEVADALAAPGNRPLFSELLEILRNDSQAQIVPPSQDLFDRGITLYKERRDKEWSLTDCISFAVMTEMSIKDALTGDHHFEQAGFATVLG